MKFTKALPLVLLTAVSIGNLSANEDVADKKKFEPPVNRYGKSIYPFVPVTTDYINQRTRIMSEDSNYIVNFNEIMSKGLSAKNTQNAITPGEKPWMSTYWPLNKGLIADPYRTKLNVLTDFVWKPNHKRLVKRQEEVQPKWRELDAEEMDELAPSEKYDILIGDENFTLTKKVVKYMDDWGSKKENAFLSKVDKLGGNTFQTATNYVNWNWVNGNNETFATVEEAYPLARDTSGGLTDHIAAYLLEEGKARTLQSALAMAKPIAIKEQSNYIMKPASTRLATWEGICHGWATAAGHVPRPRKTVTFELENGKKLNFFPDDLKALASYMWANSLIQDERRYDETTDKFSGGGILMQGLRCNDSFAKRDPWGRTYDDGPDPHSKKLEPRCVGVHPALWHLGLVNIIGNQGRTIVVERKVKAAVDNHPMYGYKAVYFNPYDGEYDGDIASKIKPITKEDDQFFAFRNKEATHVVGVRLEMSYINWNRPTRSATDDESMDETREIEMIYDLELDKNGNIIGGQWRATETGKANIFNAERKQPDFFWSVTKDYKSYFKGRTDLPEWKSGLPPKEYKAASIQASNNKYYSTPEFGWNDRCTIERDNRTKLNKNLPKTMRVNCEHIYDRPQPLVQVIDKLIEMAK